VRAGKISEVRVMDSYSFMSVPFTEAEKILRSFKSQGDRKRPFVQKADEMKKKPGKKRDKKK